VLVLIDAQESQLARQSQIRPERRKLQISLGQSTIGLARGAEQRALTTERGIFEPDLPRRS